MGVKDLLAGQFLQVAQDLAKALVGIDRMTVQLDKTGPDCCMRKKILVKKINKSVDAWIWVDATKVSENEYILQYEETVPAEGDDPVILEFKPGTRVIVEPRKMLWGGSNMLLFIVSSFAEMHGWGKPISPELENEWRLVLNQHN